MHVYPKVTFYICSYYDTSNQKVTIKFAEEIIEISTLYISQYSLFMQSKRIVMDSTNILSQLLTV